MLAMRPSRLDAVIGVVCLATLFFFETAHGQPDPTVVADGVTFVAKDASSSFDVTIRVAKCDERFCDGAVSFSFHPKGSARVFQVIEASDTTIWLSKSGQPPTNQTGLYDLQSAINVGDFNFDGVEDVALCTGRGGSYGMPSYDVYLGTKTARTKTANTKTANTTTDTEATALKFVHSPALSVLGKHLGMFEVDPDQKQLTIFDKDGCCWHVTQSYAVVKNRPKMVYERIEDARHGTTSVTERTLVRGKWKTVKH